jgi:hypothetical protein
MRQWGKSSWIERYTYLRTHAHTSTHSTDTDTGICVYICVYHVAGNCVPLHYMRTWLRMSLLHGLLNNIAGIQGRHTQTQTQHGYEMQGLFTPLQPNNQTN